MKYVITTVYMDSFSSSHRSTRFCSLSFIIRKTLVIMNLCHEVSRLYIISIIYNSCNPFNLTLKVLVKIWWREPIPIPTPLASSRIVKHQFLQITPRLLFTLLLFVDMEYCRNLWFSPTDMISLETIKILTPLSLNHRVLSKYYTWIRVKQLKCLKKMFCRKIVHTLFFNSLSFQ